MLLNLLLGESGGFAMVAGPGPELQVDRADVRLEFLC